MLELEMKRNSNTLVEKFTHQGPLWREHNFPPAPFNPDYDPKAKDKFHTVTSSMETDNFYATHTREECKREWAKRYQTLKT
jgi:hypothetical protein